MKNSIQIFDTTLRDGEQAPGFGMNVNEKLRLAKKLELLGVDVIEAGFPICSKGDFDAVKAIAEQSEYSRIAGLARTCDADIEAAGKAVQPAKKSRIHTFIATSDIHMEYKLRMTREQVLQETIKGVAHAKSWCDNVEFSAEDATRSDVSFLIEVFQAAVEAGADVINVPDTVGYGVPWEFGELIGKIRKSLPEHVVISVHCHNDLGLAVANSLMAVRNGATQIECTINGIGERAGNASLEEVAMAMHTRNAEFEYQTNINHKEIFPASVLLSEITGQSVQLNKAVVGGNAFSHEAGIHQHGMLSNPLTYEIMTPETVGKSGSNLVLGKHSGRKALSHRLKELGFEFDKSELNKVYEGFINLADSKKIVNDDDLNFLANQINNTNVMKAASSQ